MKTTLETQMEVMLTCPITGETMTDPVVDPEGNSYEKSAILDWISRNGSSPITRTPLRSDQLTPNRALRDLLEAHQSGNSISITSTSNSNEQGVPSSPNVSVNATYNENGLGLVQVSVADEESLDHSPSSVVCVLDVSSSMEAEATMKEGGAEGPTGLSLLDVVKHATTTVIETLSNTDKLAIIAYSNEATMVLPFTDMTSSNRTKAKEAVRSLRCGGCTNLWDGLLKAMELVRIEQTPNANILLLTDGLPNISPPRGELHSLRRYQDSHPQVCCRINTYGFGYSIDSELLNSIAMAGGGHYGFIPDSSFVGTVFINGVANILSTAIVESTLLLEAAPGVTIEKCLSFEAKSTSWGMSITMPSLRYGQTFDVLVKFNSGQQAIEHPFSALLRRTPIDATYDTKAGAYHTNTSPGESNEAASLFSLAEPLRKNDFRIKVASVRCEVVDLLRSSERDGILEKARESFQVLLERLSSSEKWAQHTSVKALQGDLKGQIDEAYSRQDWHSKWGKHYILSLSRAHELQQCTNFKDPGVQVYATKKFSHIRDVSDDLFCKLPPPKPSRALSSRRARLYGNSSMSPGCSMRASMARFHNRSNPCFAAGSVRLSDGRYISVSRVVAGDEITTTSGGPPAKVRCVVATACEGGVAELVELEGGVLVTPWHPIRPKTTTKWAFPSDLASTQLYLCDKVYSFVLEDAAGVMQIGPYEAVALGHGITNDPIAKHNYLGTDKVIQDLSNMQGWSNGMVELAPNPAIRDSETGLVIGYKQMNKNSGHQKLPYPSTKRYLEESKVKAERI